MNDSKRNNIRQESISEFGSAATQREYTEIAERGLWESEKLLIEKYFKPHSMILDIGCGSGRTAIPLQRAGYNVTGVDITPEMIVTAIAIAKGKNLPIDYRVGDATKLDLPDETFDAAIFANSGWAQIPGKNERQEALCEIYRVLKPNGIFILASHIRYLSPSNSLFWLKQWMQYHLLKRLGYKTEGIEYGDIFFERKHDKTIRQFMHMSGARDIAKQIKKAGFELLLEKSMSTISKQDAVIGWGQLNSSFNSYKSPMFYVCKKV